MYVTVEPEITMKVDPEVLWEFISNPERWTSANPKEHVFLKYFCPENRPIEGVEFHQREYLQGICIDLKGKILHAQKPSITVWSGTACYRLLGNLFRIRLSQGGVLRINKTEDGLHMSHSIYIHFTDSVFGRILEWIFLRMGGKKAINDFTRKEMVYFKAQLEAKNVQKGE